MSLLQRFTPRIIITETDCWEWQGSKSHNGYAMASVDGRQQYVHRVLYTELTGPIPVGLDLDHLCRVRRCVNPAHLEPVTRRENLLRGETTTARNAAKTHCLRGHELTDTNTTTDPGRRVCLLCRRERDRKRTPRRRGQKR